MHLASIVDEVNNCESKLCNSFSEEEFEFLIKTSKDTEASIFYHNILLDCIAARVLSCQFIEKV